MADNLNTDGNIEVYPGPRGFSVVDAKGDGTNVRFVTDEPRTLGPVGERGRTHLDRPGIPHEDLDRQ